MAVMSPDAIRELWIESGGSPQYADKAVQVAYTKSGGNSDATGGLWGKKVNPNSSPLDEAKSVVQATNNGRDFAAYTDDDYSPLGALGNAAETSLGKAFPDLASLFGVTDTFKYVTYLMMIGAGGFLMLVGLALMIVGSARVRRAVGSLFGMVATGAAFGVGSRVGGGPAITGDSARVVGPPPPPTPPAYARGPRQPLPPTAPAGGAALPRKTTRTMSWTFPDQPPVSQGGQTHGTRKVPSGYKPRHSQADPPTKAYPQVTQPVRPRRGGPPTIFEVR